MQKNGQTSPKRRRSYRAPDAVRRSVRLCTDAPNRAKGKHTGAVKLAAYGYPHLGAIFDMSDKSVRLEVQGGRLVFNSLASIIAFAVSDDKRLAHVLKIASSRQLPLVSKAPQLPRPRRRAPKAVGQA